MGDRHVELIHSDTGCELVGVCDSDSGKRDVGDKYGVPFFSNIKTLIEKTHPEGAVIATPSAHHAEAVRICSRYGVHVLIEKPMSNTPSSAQEIVDLSKNTQIKGGHLATGKPPLASRPGCSMPAGAKSV